MTEAWLKEWTAKFEAHRPGSIRGIDLCSMFFKGEFLEFMHQILEHKQALYLQLSGVDLSTESGRYMGAKLQGQIMALDFLPELMQLNSEETTNDGSTRD